jgi:thioredoxin-like negative regulator of GroEL
MGTISEALAIALQHHQAGRLQSAEQIYRQILEIEPNHADAVHLLGLPELIAQTPEQYVRIAVELAQDRSRLIELRATLRGRMQASPLMDAPRYARNVEAAYRSMWQRWCSQDP